MDTKIKELTDSLDLTEETRNDEERNVREFKKHLDYLMNIYHKEQNDDSVDNYEKLLVKNLKKMKLHI